MQSQFVIVIIKTCSKDYWGNIHRHGETLFTSIWKRIYLRYIIPGRYGVMFFCCDNTTGCGKSWRLCFIYLQSYVVRSNYSTYLLIIFQSFDLLSREILDLCRNIFSQPNLNCKSTYTSTYNWGHRESFTHSCGTRDIITYRAHIRPRFY